MMMLLNPDSSRFCQTVQTSNLILILPHLECASVLVLLGRVHRRVEVIGFYLQVDFAHGFAGIAHKRQDVLMIYCLVV